MALTMRWIDTRVLYFTLIAVLICLILVVDVCGVMIGAAPIPVAAMWQIFRSHLFGGALAIPTAAITPGQDDI